MKVKKWDLLICIGLALILLIFVKELGNTNAAARTYPAVMLGASYLLMAILVIQWVRSRKERKEKGEPGMEPKRMLYILVYCVSILIYIMLIERLGYVVSTIAFGVYSLLYLKNRNIAVIIAVPVLLTVVLYFLFSQFLFVKLPTGMFI